MQSTSKSRCFHLQNLFRIRQLLLSAPLSQARASPFRILMTARSPCLAACFALPPPPPTVCCPHSAQRDGLEPSSDRYPWAACSASASLWQSENPQGTTRPGEPQPAPHLGDFSPGPTPLQPSERARILGPCSCHLSSTRKALALEYPLFPADWVSILSFTPSVSLYQQDLPL